MSEIINFTEINTSIINDCLMLEKLLKNEGLGRILRDNTQIVDEMIKELTFEIQTYFTQILIVLKDIQLTNSKDLLSNLTTFYKNAYNNFLNGDFNLVKEEINNYNGIKISIDKQEMKDNYI